MKSLKRVFILTMVLTLLGMSYVGAPKEVKTAEDIPFTWSIRI